MAIIEKSQIDKLIQNLIDQIKEMQIKLGYCKETMRFYYTLPSLNSILKTGFSDIGALTDVIKSEELFSDTVLGNIQFAQHEDRIEIRVMPEGAEYVNENVTTSPFLVDLISLFATNHHCSIEDICGVFRKHSDYFCCEKMQPEMDFDYVLYFQKDKIDSYYYCVKMEMGHTIYHRFLEEDYLELIEK